MKILVFLITLLQTILMPITPVTPVHQWPKPHVSINSEKTNFSSPDEWVNEQNRLLENLSKRENLPDLTMKIVKTEIRDGVTFLRLSVPHDKTDEYGNTVYINELLTVYLQDGYIHFIED